jgi:cytochrome c oxidase assembly protein subunit 15
MALRPRSQGSSRLATNARASFSYLGSTRSISFTPHSKNSATLSQLPPSAFSSDDSKTRSDSHSDSLPILTTPAVARWLYISSGLVFFIVVVGGVTRLTESGLSITEWEPVKGILPPIGEEQWLVEWEKYRVTPEGVL